MEKFKFKKFKLPTKPKVDHSKVIEQLRSYGVERNLPSNPVVSAHKQFYNKAS